MGMFLNRGNQEFDRVVNSEIYIDKTDMITFLNKKINTEQRYISVSRPRRFGKSITANMIAAYFEKGCDSRYLFENRKLGETKNWDQNLNKYDVIRIDLADIRSRRENPEETLDYIDEMVVKELDEAYPDLEAKKQAFKEVTEEDMAKMAREIFRTKNLTVVIKGNKKLIPERKIRKQMKRLR